MQCVNCKILKAVKPLSKFKKSDLVNFGHSLAFARFLAKEKIWHWTDWHDCSKNHNRVYLYSPADLLVSWGLFDDFEKNALIKEFEETKKSNDEEIYNICGEYKDRSFVTHKFKNAIKKGDWIVLENGRKKKAHGKNIYWEVEKDQLAKKEIEIIKTINSVVDVSKINCCIYIMVQNHQSRNFYATAKKKYIAAQSDLELEADKLLNLNMISKGLETLIYANWNRPDRDTVEIINNVDIYDIKIKNT